MAYTDKAYIADKIRVARKKAGLTQIELANALGVTSKQLSRIEVGTYVPSLQSFLKMVEVLNLDLKDFGIETSENKNPVRDEIIKIINAADDKELDFYLKCLKTISENIKLIN